MVEERLDEVAFVEQLNARLATENEAKEDAAMIKMVNECKRTEANTGCYRAGGCSILVHQSHCCLRARDSAVVHSRLSVA